MTNTEKFKQLVDQHCNGPWPDDDAGGLDFWKAFFTTLESGVEIDVLREIMKKDLYEVQAIAPIAGFAIEISIMRSGCSTDEDQLRFAFFLNMYYPLGLDMFGFAIRERITGEPVPPELWNPYRFPPLSK